MKVFGAGLTLLAICNCTCGSPSPGSTGGTTATATTAGPTGGTAEAGASGGTSSGSSTGAGASGGGTSAGEGSSGGSNGGYSSCGPNAVWVNEVCTLTSCSPAPIDTPCLPPDGGSGFCGAGLCQGGTPSTPTNCNWFGAQCPAGDTCNPVIGCLADGGVGGCGAGTPPCPSGTQCDDGDTPSVCLWSVCTASLTDQACGSGGAIGFCCGSSCVFGDDPSNCGACGLSCGNNAICVDEKCVPVAPCSSATDNSLCPLPGGTGFCCDGACQDPSTDTQDCRACGQSCNPCTLEAGGCPQGQGCTVDKLCAPLTCVGSADGLACSLPDLAMTTDLGQGATLEQWGSEVLLTECCAGACVDLDFDSANCGACGVICPGGTACQGGRCLQTIDCSLAANASPCWLGSSGGEGECCEGSCVDTTSDATNCLLCGASCKPGDTCAGEDLGCLGSDGGSYFPQTSSCGPISDGEGCGLDGGSGVCCAGSCVNPTAIDSCALCGLGCLPCSVTCPTGTTCVNQGYENNGTLLVPVDTCLPTACAPGRNGGECAFGPSVPGPYESLQPVQGGSGSAFRLFNPGFCCGGECVDIGQDPNNCGLCGVVCPSGICALALGGVATCFSPQPDNDCLATCGSNQVCANGLCVGSGCSSPYETNGACAAEDGNVGLCCPGSEAPFNGLCSDLANDPLNCGGCGFACPIGQGCMGGACAATPASCGDGRIGAFCDLDAGPAYLCCPGVGCTSVASDNANCGGCGVKCASGTSCASGSCQ
jgi:hypothetical protein